MHIIDLTMGLQCGVTAAINSGEINAYLPQIMDGPIEAAIQQGSSALMIDFWPIDDGRANLKETEKAVKRELRRALAICASCPLRYSSCFNRLEEASEKQQFVRSGAIMPGYYTGGVDNNLLEPVFGITTSAR